MTDAPTSFNISWKPGTYYVDIPNYQGGRVYTAKAVNALVEAMNDLHVWCEREGCGDQAEIIKDAFKEAGITEYRCENCDGIGEWDEGPLPARHSTQISPDYRHMVCDDCAGKGTISLTSAERE